MKLSPFYSGLDIWIYMYVDSLPVKLIDTCLVTILMKVDINDHQGKVPPLERDVSVVSH